MRAQTIARSAVAYLLILAGLALVVLPVLAWLGVIQPAGDVRIASATAWDVLLALVQQIPWVALLGLILIYAGLKLLDVNLPF